MSDTVADSLIDRLRDVRDLDSLHHLLSNDYCDANASPRLTAWFVELVNAERQRRDKRQDWNGYPYPLLTDLEPGRLVQAALLGRVISEQAAMEGEPSIQAFAFKLSELLTGALCLDYLQLVQAIGTNHETN